jgi:hypothetical protein
MAGMWFTEGCATDGLEHAGLEDVFEDEIMKGMDNAVRGTQKRGKERVQAPEGPTLGWKGGLSA